MRWMLLVSLAGFSFVCTFPANAQSPANAPAIKRNPDWATKVPDVPEVPNLYLVAPNFYRSPQPTLEGFKALANRKGLRTVVSLRAFHSDQPITQGLGLRLFDFQMHTWHIEREDVVGALRTLRSELSEGPTLLHCEHGADRTGLVSALYRIVYQGWSKDAARQEMEDGDFGFHDIWINIPHYIRDVDVDKLKRDLGAR
jgi:protein tyrosine/serine phosphatase